MNLCKVIFGLSAMGLLLNAPAFCGELPYQLGHLTLKSAQQLFELNNHELKAASIMLKAREADAMTAAQKPNPLLSLGVSNLNLNRSQGNTNNGSNSLQDQTLNSALQISQLIERGEKRELRMASANDAIKATQMDLQDTKRQLTLLLNNAFYDLLLSQELEKINIENLNLYKKTIEAAELRLKAGDVASNDVSRMRVDALKTENDLRQAQNNRQKAQSNLAYLIGKSNEANSINADDVWPETNDALKPINDDAINKRPDVLAAEIRIKQAEENERLAQSLKTRDINIALQYQHFPGQMPGADVNTIGATVTVPLFTNYEYQGEIARAQTEVNSALSYKEQAQSSAITDLNKAHSDVQSTLEKNQRFNQQILLEAHKAADAAEFAYSHGAAGITDLLDARRVLRTLELDAANVKADYAKALAALEAANKTIDINDSN